MPVRSAGPFVARRGRSGWRQEAKTAILVENGRLVKPAEDPCAVRKRDRTVSSDGRTRLGWPVSPLSGVVDCLP
jgi:hypothetical protein